MRYRWVIMGFVAALVVWVGQLFPPTPQVRIGTASLLAIVVLFAIYQYRHRRRQRETPH